PRHHTPSLPDALPIYIGNANSGGGAGAGKVQIQDFHFTMTTSKASPTLLKVCATGEHIKDATLSCRKAGGSQQDFMIIKMNDVIDRKSTRLNSSHQII